MAVHHITNSNFREEVLLSDQPVLVDFWAPWCGPCRMVGPILEQIAAEHPEIKVCKINVDEEAALASQFRIASIPALLAIQNGKVEDKLVGARPKNQILELFGI